MLLPLKALRNGQLRNLDGDLPWSGHDVSKVEFTDIDGAIKIGFFKPISSSYPTLLAKYAVAMSIAIRLALGDRAAEDRLVFDEKQRIIGTVSVSLPHYKPLYSYLDSIKAPPSDPQEREMVIPSTETLLGHDMASLLVSAWRFKCDDRHPGNLSLNGLIDWDMCLYPYTYIMKGSRLVDEITCKLPEKAMRLEFQDLDNFPQIENRTHWPAQSTPGNIFFVKRCAAYLNFQELASNKTLAGKKESVCFQEQMFNALLKELLTYDPDVLRERLQESLRGLTLNYTNMMDKEKAKQLTKKYPKLFNKEADKLSFIDHIMQVFNKEYEELYDTVVHYPGCEENKSHTTVAAFKTFLRNKPTAYKNILDWMELENKKRREAKHQTLLLKKVKTSTILKIDGESFQEKNLNTDGIFSCESKETKGSFNLEKVERRYHQIWRDAHFSTLANIVADSQTLIKSLANELKIRPDPRSPLYKIRSVIGSSSELKEWCESTSKIKESSNLQCDKNNKLRVVLLALEEFVEDLDNHVKSYLRINQKDLELEHNRDFCEKIATLIQTVERKIFQPTFQGNSWVEKFGEYIKRLEQCHAGLNLNRHLFDKKDIPLNQSMQQEYSVLLTQKHTDEEIVDACLNELFKWVNKMPQKDFNSIVSNTAREYGSFFHFFTDRRPKVAAYIANRKEDNANTLANILSEGGIEKNSLNTLLVNKLTSLILEDKEINFQLHWVSVRQACHRKQFDASFYAKKAQNYALQNQRFTHLYSSQRVTQFEEYLFQWVDTLPRAFFVKIVRDGLDKYHANLTVSFLRKGRRPEVEKYFRKYPHSHNSEILALILSSGSDSSTCSKELIEELINCLKKDVKHKIQSKNLPDPDLKFILDLKEDHVVYYKDAVKKYAESLMEDNPSSLTSSFVSNL